MSTNLFTTVLFTNTAFSCNAKNYTAEYLKKVIEVGSTAVSLPQAMAPQAMAPQAMAPQAMAPQATGVVPDVTVGGNPLSQTSAFKEMTRSEREKKKKIVFVYCYAEAWMTAVCLYYDPDIALELYVLPRLHDYNCDFNQTTEALIKIQYDIFNKFLLNYQTATGKPISLTMVDDTVLSQPNVVRISFLTIKKIKGGGPIPMARSTHVVKTTNNNIQETVTRAFIQITTNYNDFIDRRDDLCYRLMPYPTPRDRISLDEVLHKYILRMTNGLQTQDHNIFRFVAQDKTANELLTLSGQCPQTTKEGRLSLLNASFDDSNVLNNQVYEGFPGTTKSRNRLCKKWWQIWKGGSRNYKKRSVRKNRRTKRKY